MFGARRGALASAIRRVTEGGELDYVPDPHIDNVVFLAQLPFTNAAAPVVSSRVGSMCFRSSEISAWRALSDFGSIAPPIEWGDRLMYGGLNSQRIDATNFAKYITMEEDWTIEGYFGLHATATNTGIKGILFSSDVAGFRWGYTPTSMSFSIKGLSMSGAITTDRTSYNYAALSKTGDIVSMYFNGSLITTLNVTGVTLTDAPSTLFFLSAGGIPTANNSISSYLMRVTKGVGRYSGSTHEVPTKPFQDWSDVSGDPLFYRNGFMWQATSDVNNRPIRHGGDNSFASQSLLFNSQVGNAVENSGPFPGTASSVIGSTSTTTRAGTFFGTQTGIVNSFTVECFFRQAEGLTNTARQGYSINLGRAGTSGNNTGPCGVLFDASNNNMRLLIMRADGVNTDTLLTTDFPAAGVWHHLVVVKDFDTFSMYLDGERIGIVTDSDYVPFDAQTTVSAFWGRTATNATAQAEIAMYRATAGVRYTGETLEVPTEPYPTKQLGRVVNWADIFNFL